MVVLKLGRAWKDNSNTRVVYSSISVLKALKGLDVGKGYITMNKSRIFSCEVVEG